MYIELDTQIDNFMNFMANIQNASEHTLKAYQLDLAQAFGSRVRMKNLPGSNSPGTKQDPRRLTSQEILQQAKLAQSKWGSLAIASRNRKASTLKAFFNYLYEKGLTPKNLAFQIPAAKVPKKIPNFLSVDEALIVLKNFREPEQKLEKILFCLLYGCGLRISEASQIRVKDLQLTQHTLKVRGKGGKERIVAIPRSLIPILESIPHSEYIWGDSPLDTRKAYEWIRQSGKRAGLLKPIHPHALRHSFATHLLTSGANLRTLQELLGHQSLTATEKYTHLSVDHLARIMETHHPLQKKSK